MLNWQIWSDIFNQNFIRRSWGETQNAPQSIVTSQSVLLTFQAKFKMESMEYINIPQSFFFSETENKAQRIHTSIEFEGRTVNFSPSIYRSAHTRRLVPATSPCKYAPEELRRRDWSQGIVPRTVHKKPFEEQVAVTCPKNSNQSEFVGQVA